ncbi:hypothetical protein Pla52o_10300 [Novipirellula galeiformis]|uniref:Uncharacterized protein n=1 Tax=Novipirellula galeiformis TaxID=2528004 RepID=A0A5C6CW08_9BACT|nr:HAD-IIIC family phosphatase [Novipirellula galeiformis]TWU27166.1 hypothetical protein Pla52o_10300 [Novipirellula galeiformis]
MEVNHFDKRARLAECKSQIAAALNDQNFSEVQLWLARAWDADPSAALSAWTKRTLDPVRDDFCLAGIKVAFLRAYTIEPAVALLTASAYTQRLRIDPFLGQFNTYAQELLTPGSDYHRFEADVTILALLTRVVAPELWDGFASRTESDTEKIVDRVCNELGTLMDHFRKHNSGYMVIHNLEPPPLLCLGIGDPGRPGGQRDCIQRINQFLRCEIDRRPGFCLLDMEHLVYGFGASRWYDEQRWQTIRLPMASDAVAVLAKHWLKHIGALSLPAKKVLVVDLDNTMWHGVVGEDGYDGIRLDDSPAGQPHRKLQQALLDLHHRGVLLAICSKNNHADAWQVIQQHPDMLLRPEHFAAVRINWENKSSNLQSLAAELNVGIDSFVFLDDNPVEQQQVRHALPQVRVLDVGKDASGYSAIVRDEIGFERRWVSQDDQNRGRMYAQQRSRRDAQAESSDLETYLHSLETVVERIDPDAAMLERVAQLTQKTNQFNLTTRRYSIQQINELSRANESEVLAFQVSDRFGDSGIVGVAILRFEPDGCEIDSLLMSCRVIGRNIETAMLTEIIDIARLRSCERIIGRYIPTAKNSPCADFYDQHGFVFANGAWELNCGQRSSVEMPAWIKMRVPPVTPPGQT